MHKFEVANRQSTAALKDDNLVLLSHVLTFPIPRRADRKLSTTVFVLKLKGSYCNRLFS